MDLLLILLRWSAVLGRCGGPNTLGSNSRFGEFNSRLGRCKFPFSAATGIRSQGLDLLLRFCNQTAVAGGKSTKFPVQREKPGSWLGRLVRHDDGPGGGEHAADAMADRDLGAGDLGGG